MHVAGVVCLVTSIAACEALPAGLSEPESLVCGGTEPALCRAVAQLAIAQMNLTATGPITTVTLTQVDCVRTARSNFRQEMATAVDCWTVEVMGERSHGGGLVAHYPDGTLQPYWP